MKKNENITIWAIFKEPIGFSAAKIDDNTYYTAGNTIDEIINNIPEVFSLLKGDSHIKRPVKEKADFYIIVSLNGNKARLIRKIESLKTLDKNLVLN